MPYNIIQEIIIFLCGRSKFPKALTVFNVPPLQEIICKEVIGKMSPTGHVYIERPEVRVIPLHIPPSAKVLDNFSSPDSKEPVKIE